MLYIKFEWWWYDDDTSILGQIGGPESEIVSQELHDQGAVLVWLFTQGV